MRIPSERHLGINAGQIAESGTHPISFLGGEKATIWGHKPLISVIYGGDDGARTRDLCRDS